MSAATISIRTADGGAFSGYLAAPASGSGPGLILLHEIFGVNRHIRELADLYAEEGYFVARARPVLANQARHRVGIHIGRL